MFKNHQELYKVSASTGKTQVWKGWTVGDDVCSCYGQINGKMQTNTYKATPKNVGRSNETTKEEQAQVELQAMYKDQIENKHYFTSEVEAIEKAQVCRIPRKVYNYKDHKQKHVNDTMYSSIKFNGSRGCVVDGVFYSKIGRQEDIKVERLRRVVEVLGQRATFDAEVYAHGLSLQRIRSAWLKPVRTDKEVIKVAKDKAKNRGEVFSGKTQEDAISYLGYNPNEDAGKLKFYVFDIPTDTNKPYSERIKDMDQLRWLCSDLKLMDSFVFEYPDLTHSNEEREILLQEVVDKGYEGLVHYLPDGVYEYGKRSLNTLKAKPRYDSEALVTGVEICKNGEGKLLLKACDALGGVTFKAMMKGDHTSRMFEVQKQFIGKWVTFAYEELSDSGKPTKPVAHETRLCDAKGQPLE